MVHAKPWAIGLGECREPIMKYGGILLSKV